MEVAPALTHGILPQRPFLLLDLISDETIRSPYLVILSHYGDVYHELSTVNGMCSRTDGTPKIRSSMVTLFEDTSRALHLPSSVVPPLGLLTSQGSTILLEYYSRDHSCSLRDLCTDVHG